MKPSFTLAAIAIAVAAMACSSADSVGDGPSGPSGASSGAGGDGGGDNHSTGSAPSCDGPLGAPQDPSALPACCPDFGGAHCVGDVPADLEAYVGACDDGGYCVPDEFIQTGGVYTPPSCTSLQGAAGVCLSACVPKVAEVAGLLPQDTCKSYERCVPSISPLDNTDTGACKLGFSCDDTGAGGGTTESCDDPSTCVYDCPTPAIDPATLAPCPDGCGGHCLDEKLVPPEQASQLASCGSGALCVPDDVLEMGGKLIPKTCASIAGFEGRCLSDCLPEVAAQAAMLPKDVCAAGELCVPCYDPVEGTATGACSFSCDTGPAEPAQTLPDCCGGEGTCVPTQSVPPEHADDFGADTCPTSSALVCVPHAFLSGPYVPALCTPSTLIYLFTGQDVGACMKTCMPGVASAPYVDQGECAGDELCIPCFDQQGAPTGACETTAACAHDTCTDGGQLTWGCDGGGCVTAVCESDPYCCTDAWDSQCIDEVATYCYAPCP